MGIPLPTALLGLWLAGPSVTIRVVDGGEAESSAAERERLHGLLALRMLDKGMTVAPPGAPAEVVFELRVFGDRFVVRADAQQFAHESQISRTDPGTAELALCHGAVAAVVAVAPREEAGSRAATARSLALEIRGSNLSASADALRLSLVSQLLTRGRALTATRTATEPGLCIHDAGELVTVAYGPPGRPCGSPVFFARGADAEDDAAAREQVVGAAVALSEREDLPVSSPPAPPSAATTVADEALEAFGPPPGPPPPAPPLPAMARLAIELRAATGLAMRAGLFERAPVVVDPAFRLGLRIGRAPGLAGQLGGIVLPSHAGRSHRVLDGFVGAGLAWSRRVGGRWEIELGGLVGAYMHVLRPSASHVGTIRVRPWGELAVVASWRARRGLGLHAGLHPAASWTSGWVYYTDTSRFQRSGWSVTLSLGVSHGWRVR